MKIPKRNKNQSLGDWIEKIAGGDEELQKLLHTISVESYTVGWNTGLKENVGELKQDKPKDSMHIGMKFEFVENGVIIRQNDAPAVVYEDKQDEIGENQKAIEEIGSAVYTRMNCYLEDKGTFNFDVDIDIYPKSYC